MIDDVISRFPRQTPKGVIDVEEDHTFDVIEYEDGSSSTKYEYVLDKAPVIAVDSVSAVVDGRNVDLVEGSDYAVVDSNGDGEIDAIDFDVGGNQPDANTEFTVQYRAVPVIARYGSSHDDVAETTFDNIDAVVSSHFVDQASGSDLDRIGAVFGELGERRDRSDSDYQQYLKTIVNSFRGRGTVPGIRFAVAGGLGIDDSLVSLEEDFVNVEYSVILEDWPAHQLLTIVDIADLADPSGVKLDTVRYQVDPEEVEIGDDVAISEGLQQTETVGSNDIALVNPNQTIVDELLTTNDVVEIDPNTTKATETVTTNDPVVTETDATGSFSWDQDNWDFMEWS